MTIRASRGGGRPSKYKPEHAASLRTHFLVAVQRIDAMLSAGQHVNLPYPTCAAWCHKVGLDRCAPGRWAKRHPDFKSALDFAKQIQRDLNQLAVNGNLKFTLLEPSE